MKTGDTVICRNANGYYFTVGKEYEVLRYDPEYYDKDTPAGFTWPAYVQVRDDEGNKAYAHAHRFVVKE